MNLARAPLTDQDVRMAYRLILGREPESDAVIREKMAHESLEELRDVMLRSAEFQTSILGAAFTDSKWVAADVLGKYTMWVDLHDRYVSQGCLNNNWEPDETSYVKSRIEPGNVVLDIGANIGWFTLVAAEKLDGRGAIHAFEPRPGTVSYLQRTIAGNALQDVVTIWPVALSDEACELRLNWATNTENPGGSFVGEADEAAMIGHDSVLVRAAKLDDLLPDIKPDMIKIDVEGAEPRVMRGARNALLRSRCSILSELHPRQLQRVSGASCRTYIEDMESFGYACYRLDKGQPGARLRDFPSEAGSEIVNVVFEPA